jgi:DNA-binding FrmR family transcriptional regulator
MKHATHKQELTRLKRIEGQVKGVIRMVEEERYCVDILTQLRAVRAALRKVETRVLRGHVDHCVVAAARGGEAAKQQKLDELFGVLDKFGAG